MRAVVLVPIGVCVGLIGSLIGVGGGFFLVPFLMIFYGFSQDAATAAALGTIVLTALSASTANLRRRRIDLRTGALLAAGTVPTACLGRFLIDQLSPRTFTILFAVILVAVAIYLVIVRMREGRGLVRGGPREIVDSEGQAHRYEVCSILSVLVGLGVGLIASLFGIGGGLILVPFMVIVFGMPTLLATATAQFAFIFTSAAGFGVSIALGQLNGEGLGMMLLMGVGVIVGAQFGVAAAKQVRPLLVRWMIAVVLLTVAVLMAINSLW